MREKGIRVLGGAGILALLVLGNACGGGAEGSEPGPVGSDCFLLELVPLTDLIVRAPRGQVVPGAIRARAVDARTGSAHPGARFLVTSYADDPLLDGGVGEEMAVTADGSGEITLDALLPGRVGGVAVDVEGNLGDALYFEGRTEGVVDEIQLDLPRCAPADADVAGTFQAIDFQDEAVVGGTFEVWAVHSDDAAISVPYTERGEGRYDFTLSLERAGCHRVVVTDLESGVVGVRCLCVEPLAAAGIRLLGVADARATEPYGECVVHVRLEDALGNALPAGELTAELAGGAAVPVGLRLGDEAEITVHRTGHGDTTLTLRDPSSGVALDVPVSFAPAWLGNPGFVVAGSPFATTLYVAPEPGSPVFETAVSVSFDATRVGFTAFAPVSGISAVVESGLGTVQIQLQSEEGLAATPDGIAIGQIDWLCQAEGEACFDVSTTLAAALPAWALCVNQKKPVEGCICVNVIHTKLQKKRIGIVKKGAENFVALVNKHQDLCCPKLEVKVQETVIPRREWKRLRKSRRRGGGGLPRLENHGKDLQRLYDLVAAYRKANCINIVLYPIGDAAGIDGVMYKTGAQQGFGVIALRDHIRTRITEHEIGHAFGLSHVEGNTPAVRKRVMWEGAAGSSKGYGKTFTAGECASIAANMAKFACK